MARCIEELIFLSLQNNESLSLARLEDRRNRQLERRAAYAFYRSNSSALTGQLSNASELIELILQLLERYPDQRELFL